jgi:hypothetical protein
MQLSLFPPSGLLVALLFVSVTIMINESDGAFTFLGVKETVEFRLSMRQALDVVQRLFQVHRIIEFGPKRSESGSYTAERADVQLLAERAEPKLLLAHGHNLVGPPPPRGFP